MQKDEKGEEQADYRIEHRSADLTADAGQKCKNEIGDRINGIGRIAERDIEGFLQEFTQPGI